MTTNRHFRDRMAAIFLLLLLSALCHAQQSKEIAGVWQNSAVLGSGWSDTYLFFEDGTFRFFYSQMDCAKREVSYTGNWKLDESDLILSIIDITILEGGEMVLSTGSCGSDSTLINAVEKKLLYDPPVRSVLHKVKYHVISIDGVERKTISLDGTKYWYYGEPKEMLKQFEN